MNKNRDRICKLRLNEEEYNLFLKKSESYGGNTSAMIREAVAKFDHEVARRKIKTLTELLAFYTKFQQQLSWLGGNINQAQHRANELAIAGELSPDYFRSVIMPRTQEAMKLIRSVKNELTSIHKKVDLK